MSEQAKYSIGIDLGTTNCALSYLRLAAGSGASEVLPLEQRDELNTLVTQATLPSFLYLPNERERSAIGDGEAGLSDGWVVGVHARKQSSVAPERVAHSAKSWLAHHAVSPEAPILPWKSEAVEEGRKLSPIAASAALLGYLKSQWNERFAGGDPAAAFERQRVTVTVPASFDAASQRATLEAARRAGYPESTRLLEEPQAAFYRWLESGADLGVAPRGACILVVDIGGGTSDFSLFRVGEAEEGGRPTAERVAVSDHILLGGDNIDLALAYALESELGVEGEELSADQWSHLIARARELKERCLGAEAEEQRFTVSLPSKGSGLLAGSRSTQVAASDARGLLLDGFFPMAPVTASPERPSGGLLEWGLPYAPDCAVTRYLAEFLRGQGKVDAVLFNGGTMASPLIRTRLLEQVGAWQGGAAPVALRNEETDLSVARGAAFFGALQERGARGIASGAARVLYLEVAAGEGARQLMAILPRGARAGDPSYRVERAKLRLAVNQLARFQVYQGGLQSEDTVGSLRPLDTQGMTQLPALETRIEFPEAVGQERVPVAVLSSINELGLLQVECVSTDPETPGSWSLDFNLRDALDEEGIDASTTQEVKKSPRIDEKRLQRGRAAVSSGLAGGGSKGGVKASRVFKELESILGLSRHEWDLRVSRGLGDAALGAAKALRRSEAHAECWMQLAGYLLRPGFGDLDDGRRLDTVWELGREPEAFAARAEVQALILWRRLAGGLDEARQEALFAAQWPLARERKKGRAERIRMLGTLERVSLEGKASFADWCVEQAVAVSRAGGDPVPYLAALGQVLSRALWHAGPERVLPPEQVADAFERLAKLDWKDERHAELAPLFLKGARVVDDRTLNLPARSRRKVVAQLKRAGVAEARLRPMEDYLPLSRADRASAYGESLPPGLLLG